MSNGRASRKQRNYIWVLQRDVLALARERDLTEIVERVEKIEPDAVEWMGDASSVIEGLKEIKDLLQGKQPSPPSPDDWARAQRRAEKAEADLERQARAEEHEDQRKKWLNEINEWNRREAERFHAQYGGTERPVPVMNENDEYAPVIWKAYPNRKTVYGWQEEMVYGWRWSCALPHPGGSTIGGGSTTHGWRGTRDGLERHMKKYHSE